MADHVNLTREAARLMRHGHVPTAADWRRMAELMEAAAAREERHLRTVPPHKRADAAPEVGDEAWLMKELARAYLGRPPEVDGG